MTKLYTYDKWVEEFQPMPNHLRNQDNGLEMTYETYGDEVEYVKLQDDNHIWTEVDGDFGTYIISGWHYVNRIHYYITNRPWKEDIEVPTWSYRECDCIDDNGDYKNDCPECEEGMIHIPVDTAEDLKQIYGEKVEIIG